MSRDLSCPICDADVPMTGDEKPGEEIACAYCRAPLMVVPGKDEGEQELEEDL